MRQGIEFETGRSPARRMLSAIALCLSTAALHPVAAGAQDRGDGIIKQPPAVSGPAQVGATVTATGARWEPPNAPATWQWYRCGSAEPPAGEDDADFGDDGDCSEIGGATGTSYTVAGADEGSYLRVLLVVRPGNRVEWALSAPSAQVAAAPAAPPAPAPAPIAAPPPGGVLPERVVRPPRLMTPVPLVRIRGRTTPRGARLTLLMVTSPRGARISVTCRGRGCPTRTWARTAVTTRIARFERRLRAGTRLIIRITKPGRIGKHTTVFIRRNRAPLRSDRCLYPGRSRPVACPAA